MVLGAAGLMARALTDPPGGPCVVKRPTAPREGAAITPANSRAANSEPNGRVKRRVRTMAIIRRGPGFVQGEAIHDRDRVRHRRGAGGARPAEGGLPGRTDLV